MDILTRRQAKELGLKKYFTNIPCKRGHVAERLVSDYNCVVCASEWRETHQDEIQHRNQLFYSNNKEEQLNKRKKYYNSNKEKELARRKNWKTNNISLCNAYNAQRRFFKRRATPKWFTLECHKIQQLYVYTKQLESITGTSWHVDHIVPLSHELVCGLHCLDNLQIIPKTTNLLKSNTFFI